MILNGTAVEKNTTFRAQYCVIGSGMGGATVASLLARAGKDVLLVEAGGSERSSLPPPVIAQATGRPFGIPLTRCIELGGTSNAWHGNSNPLDDHDFSPRPWLGTEGWPFARQDLDPFYDQAAQLLGNGACSGLSPGLLPPAVHRGLGNIDFNSAILHPKFLEYRKPPHRWKTTLLELARSGRLRCLLETCALELVPNEHGSSVMRLKAGAPGRSFYIEAETFIVAAGTLETPRLLLNSRSRHAKGLGNHHDQVGRCLMDHPTGPFSMLRFQRLLRASVYSDHALPGGERYVRAALTLRPELQQSLRTSNHYFMIRPCIGSEHVQGDLRLSFLAARTIRDLSVRQLAGIVRSPNLLYRILVSRLGLPAVYRYGELFFMAEQLPNPQSRITLSSDRRDDFGYPIASIHWSPTSADFKSLETFVAAAFGNGLSSRRYRMAHEGTMQEWIDSFTSAAHHLGTARMAATPSGGVVDPNLQVFGVRNLFVCDGSVFPTAGSANPSLTITALGARLAQHLLQNQCRSAMRHDRKRFSPSGATSSGQSDLSFSLGRVQDINPS
jgi:choline dehydrogenase-like flavoprotein